jgi:hypothetical protein
MKGVLFALFAALMNTFVVMPEIVRGINALSSQEMLTEVVEVENLYKIMHRKSSSHFYVVLAHEPKNIATSIINGVPALEVTDTVYTPLENQSVHNGSKLEVKEAIGTLGLPFIVQVAPQ